MRTDKALAYEKWMNVEGHARQIPLISFQQDGGMRVVLKLLFRAGGAGQPGRGLQNRLNGCNSHRLLHFSNALMGELADPYAWGAYPKS